MATSNAGTQARLGAQILKSFKPTISDQTRFGPGFRDNAVQTERSDIVQLQETYKILEQLVATSSTLQKELSMSTYSLRVESKNQIAEHATNLYHHANNRLMEMEKRHRSQTDMLRRSFRTQLSDAVARISAEYKAYYDEILSGKSGRHDRKIQELTKTCAEQRATIKQNETVIQMLQAQIQKLVDRSEEPAEIEPEVINLEPEGILSQEEADELHATIENLELKVRELQMELNEKDSGGKNLQKRMADLKDQLDLERAKGEKLKAELDAALRNATTAGARASADLQAQIAMLKTEMDEQKQRLEREAEERLKRMLAEAKSGALADLEAELARQREIENKLRRERDALAGQDSSKLVKQLQDQAQHLQATIAKLQKEIKRLNVYWEQRLGVVERKLNAIREESLLRANLQRQAATLHRAAITYAPDGPVLMTSGDVASPGRPGPGQLPFSGPGIPELPLDMLGADSVQSSTEGGFANLWQLPSEQLGAPSLASYRPPT